MRVDGSAGFYQVTPVRALALRAAVDRSTEGPRGHAFSESLSNPTGSPPVEEEPAALTLHH